jgi:hypothetical protein
MSAQPVVHSFAKCALCDVPANLPCASASLAERQLHLKVQAEALSRGELRLKQLLPKAAEMCDCCRMLLLGISSEADLPELVGRIKNEIQGLREDGVPTVVPDPAIVPNLRRDPEDRPVAAQGEQEVRDKMMDKTLADSYPCSDAPSSIPNPGDDSVCPLDEAA